MNDPNLMKDVSLRPHTYLPFDGDVNVPSWAYHATPYAPMRPKLQAAQQVPPPVRYVPQHYLYNGNHIFPPPQSHQNVQYTMDFDANNMAQQLTEEELAEMQKLSNEYEPEVTGPLVGQRQLSTAIATEYASADPVFQAKTAALPQKYSHYRAVRGDGRCGWRAVAFGYFETLIRLGDANKFLEEEGRLRSLSNVLNAAGFDPMLYEDFADETFDLLRKVSNAVPNSSAEVLLLESFNNEELQNYVITHLKTLTSAWMKTHEQDYAPWLLGQTVDEYATSQILPIGSEIEHVGLSALKDVLLSPAGITLEVFYLDRSEGNEVNTHRFEPTMSGIVEIGTLRLLYRPGHYDILYKLDDFPPPTIFSVNYQFGGQSTVDPVRKMGNDIFWNIPGMELASSWVPDMTYAAPIAQLEPPSQPSDQVPVPPVSSPAVYDVGTQYGHSGNTTLSSPEVVRPLPSPAVLPTTNPPLTQTQDTNVPFRASKYEIKAKEPQPTIQKPPQTSIFFNSCYNTAHFLNPDFQPEEWHPDEPQSSSTPLRRSSA